MIEFASLERSGRTYPHGVRGSAGHSPANCAGPTGGSWPQSGFGQLTAVTGTPTTPTRGLMHP